MERQEEHRLVLAVDAYLRDGPGGIEYEFPLGGDLVIPTSEEQALLDVLAELEPFPMDAVPEIRSRPDVQRAYDLAIFSVRMAVYAARSGSVAALRAGAVGLVLDSDLLDERDVLIGPAILEDCAQRLGTNPRSVIARTSELASERRRATIFDDDLARPEDERGIKAMGIRAAGSGDQLTYTKQPWV